MYIYTHTPPIHSTDCLQEVERAGWKDKKENEISLNISSYIILPFEPWCILHIQKN